MPRTRIVQVEPRRTPPVGKQLAAAKRQIVELMQRCGMVPVELSAEQVALECDHDPALGLRDVCPTTGSHIPHQHDDRFLVFRPDVRHAVKTRGNGATTNGSDIGEMRKTRQLVEKRVERGEVEPDDPSIAPWAPNPDKYQAPKQMIRSRASAPPKAKRKPATDALNKSLPPRRSLYGGAQ